MTEKRTLPLNARQWRVLLNDHLDLFKATVAGKEAVDDSAIKDIQKHMDEIKMMVAGWYQASPVPGPTTALPDGSQMQEAKSANGAAPPKKRGRKSNAERAAMAVQ